MDNKRAIEEFQAQLNFWKPVAEQTGWQCAIEHVEAIEAAIRALKGSIDQPWHEDLAEEKERSSWWR